MVCVGTVPLTELLHLDTFAVIHLVLLGDVVASLALLAGQDDLDALLVLRHSDLDTNRFRKVRLPRPKGANFPLPFPPVALLAQW